MKNFQKFGKVLSNVESQNVTGGISVSCGSSNGVKKCTVKCANGKTFDIAGCTRASASSVNGVETVTACGQVYTC